MIPPMVLDPLPIVPKIYSSPKRKHLISYQLITSYTTISYHIISPYIRSSYIITYHIILHHIKRAYILPQQEDIFHYHIVFSSKKTSSMTIQSSPTTRHVLLPQEDIPCLQTIHIGSKHIIQDPYTSFGVRTSKIRDFNFFPDSSHDLRAMFGHHH